MKGHALLGEIISENTLTKFKIFFSSNTVPISTKLGTKHPLVKEIQVNSNEVPGPFQSRNNYVIAKIDWRSLKIIFSKETLGQFQPTLKKGYSNQFKWGAMVISKAKWLRNSEKRLTNYKKKHWARAKFNQIFHKAFLVERDSRFYN